MPYSKLPNGRCFTDNDLPPLLCTFPRVYLRPLSLLFFLL